MAFIEGTEGRDSLQAGAGDDTLTGYEGQDEFFVLFARDRTETNVITDLERGERVYLGFDAPFYENPDPVRFVGSSPTEGPGDVAVTRQDGDLVLAIRLGAVSSTLRL